MVIFVLSNILKFPIHVYIMVHFMSLSFFGVFGLSRLTCLQFIQYHVAGFTKPTIPQSPPSHLQDYSTCNNARLEFSTIFVPSFEPNEWCLKNGLHSGGLNPGPLGHESSALTTKPRLLTYNFWSYTFYHHSHFMSAFITFLPFERSCDHCESPFQWAYFFSFSSTLFLTWT
jgi:hypothetical protein